MTVSLETFKLFIEFKKKINESHIREITWVLDGKEVSLKQFKEEIHDDWESIGLSNVDYGSMLLEAIEENRRL